MPGPSPKPAHLRQRRNQKTTHATLGAGTSAKGPAIPNPDNREWHPLTVAAWTHAWASPMASQWLETDADALGRLALLWDDFYQRSTGRIMGEIRLQEQPFGLSPLDRSRLQWEVSRAVDAEHKRPRPPVRRTHDPRSLLVAVK